MPDDRNRSHSGRKPQASFDLTTLAGMLKGGESGNGAIVVGSSVRSPLLRMVADLVEDLEMPPLKKRKRYPKLSEANIATLRDWIDGGAEWPDGVRLKRVRRTDG
jgi:Planctomycete cytochrome C